MHKSKKTNYIKLLIALFAMGVMIMSFCGCTASKEAQVKELKTISNTAENYEIHCSREDNLKSHPVLSSGFIELLIDTENCSFSIHQSDDSGSPFYWSALPVLPDGQYADSEMTDANVVSINVLSGSELYSLNSQDNSVSYKTAFYDLIDNGAVFTYNIYKDEETAKKSTLTADDIAFSVKLTITLEDGTMSAECTYSNLSGNKNAVITDMQLLKWFGAYSTSGTDDFMLVPDGCGAIIKTAVHDDAFEELSFPVYGNDAALNSEESSSVVIPSFGIKRSSHAFVAIITSGDAVATIKADKSTSSDEYNIVYPEFNISPYSLQDGKLYTSGSGNSYNDAIGLCYRFVSGSNATYSGMASACREQLIRDSVLSSRNVSDSGSLPFNVSVIATEKSNIFSNFSINKAVTDTEQATDMVTRMKNKGINNINIRYRGIFEGGLTQNDITSANLLLRLGTKSDFGTFYSYIDTQNMKLFFDINILGAGRGLGIGSMAKGITGKTIAASAIKYRSVTDMDDLAEKTLLSTKNYSYSGYCINDAGGVLYSDYSSGGYNREDVKSVISQAVTPLTTNNSTMACGGNFYILKNVNTIVSLPSSTSVSPSGAYEPIPFIQIILHGIADYSGQPLNLESDPEEAMLKSIEFGACPYFEWTYEESSEDSPYCYDNWINSASDFYSESDSVLSDLRQYRITDHSMVADGIYVTEYENGALIYVNYTDKDYTVSGITVGANSFERVN